MPTKKKNRINRDKESKERISSSENPKYVIQLFEYTKDSLTEIEEFSKIEFKKFQEEQTVSWLNMHGIADAKPVEIICHQLGIHDLVLEDILDTNQRPKLQEYEDYLQFSIKSIIPGTDKQLIVEQISFILGKNYLLSFQEKHGEYFKEIRHRLRHKKGIVREHGADYLLFLLLDAILDNYFNSVEETEEKISKLMKFDVNSDPKPSTIFEIERLKTDVLLLKKLIEPLKTSILNIENDQDFIHTKHIKYYSELVDQCNQLLDETNTLYRSLESANSLFFSLQGYRMNQIMKTLTIIATIFIPLTFIAGVYGMNFDVMPELRYRWGYFVIWGIMLSAILVMVIYFKRKKWF